MLKKFKKLVIASTLFCLSSTLALADTSIKIMPNKEFKAQNLSDAKIRDIVKQNIDLTKLVDVLEIRVQTIFNPKTNSPDHLLVYTLSAKNYSYTITQIKLNSAFQKTAVVSHYHLSKLDQSQQPGMKHLNDITCPDTAVEMLSATPVSYIRTAGNAIKHITNLATAYKYNAKSLLDTDATVENYVAYLSCPNLKGFYNIGHGSEDGIMLDDGILSHDVISEKLKDTLHEKVVVLFNSCEVFQDPLKGSLINDADAQKYAGGITPLRIGPSELASQCFWVSAFAHYDATSSLEFCNYHFDQKQGDIWGIDGKGSETLRLPG
jgi:hypothetical protein